MKNIVAAALRAAGAFRERTLHLLHLKFQESMKLSSHASFNFLRLRVGEAAWQWPARLRILPEGGREPGNLFR